ncbi:hypothetical protein VaNZ11_002826 [Volvox africanus]|uniref:histidine kinase n=1 Tax=Volvox africanus TaxID=51714 RepID=A0ABQ5RT40_9CHLO|nr:hypothetical protein VaNZ11_002826 [Volvox africanus]
MESDVMGHRSRVVLKTVSRMPRTFMSQLYAVDMAVSGWVSLGSLLYAICAYYLRNQNDDSSCKAGIGEQVASVEWTFQVQTSAFGAVLLLNLLNLGMRQHLLPFKCNLLLLYINGVAFVTDLLLWRGQTTVLLSSSGRPFAPLRYVQWCHSTPTMIYMLALLADFRGWQLAVPLLSDLAMVATGLVACYTQGFFKDAMTLVSFAAFAIVLYYVYSMFHKTLSGDVSPEQRSTLRTVLALLLALWSAFPVVWLAADWNLMSLQAEAVCWGVCDYLAKVVFSSQLWQSNLTEVQLRRDRALEAWEASNRVEAVERLTALLKQRDDLLSTLSHELRTPLAGIVALSETLCQEVAAALPRSAQNLATVRATATCMLNIVTSTLDSFAARHGAQPAGVPHLGDEAPGPVAPSVPLHPVDLQPIVETVTTVLRPLAHDGVLIISDLPTHLPQVTADATRLSQVLYNLVGNAMRFTSHGEVRVAARVVLPEGLDTALCRSVDSSAPDPTPANSNPTANGNGGSIWRYARPRLSQSSASSCSSVVNFPTGTQVEVSVEDTGVGIAQELLDELFLPYRTGDSVQCGDASGGSPSLDTVAVTGRASRSIGGTGLGLYLVRLALRAQGSDITAESAPGIGSVFRFRLQVAQQQQQQTSQQIHQPIRRSLNTSNAQVQQSGPHTKLQQQQQQQQGTFDDLPVFQPHLNQQQLHADEESGSHRRLSASACDLREARSSCTLSAVTAASDGSGTERALAAPSSPKQAVLSSPKPWIASPTARLVKLSSASTATAGGRMNGSASGGGSGAGLTAAAATGLASTCQRPSLPLQRRPRHLYGCHLRMSLDEQCNLLQLAPPAAATASSSSGQRCKSACAGGYCVSEVPCIGCEAPASSSEAQDAAPSGSAALIAADALPAAADTRAGVAGDLAVLAPPVRVLTPTRTPAATPTAATSQVSTKAAALLTPFDVSHAIEERQARAGLRPNFRHRNNGTLQVMSVDDDPINQLVAGQMLASQSWKVVKCMNGPEALAYLQLMPKPSTAAAVASASSSSQSAPAVTPPTAASSLLAAAIAAQPLLLPAILPDCVLLDVMMPGMSGFEVCRKLRQHFNSAQLPIIIVSAKGDSAAVDEAFDSGADDYMTKPYKRTEMVARIRAQIRIRDSVLDTAAVTGTAAAVTPSTPPAYILSAPPQLSVTTVPAATQTGGSTPRPCSAVLAAKGQLACSGTASELPSPSLSPLHPLSQPHHLPSTRVPSVDVLLLQQPTPDAIKMRMEASRGGLDGSWGRVGLYKRDSILGRNAAGEGGSTPCDASERVGPTKDLVTAPVAAIGSLQNDFQPSDAALIAAAAPLASAESSDDLQDCVNKLPTGPTVTADMTVGTSRALPTLPEGTVAIAAESSGALPANTACLSAATCMSSHTLMDRAVATATNSSETASITAGGIASAAADAAAVQATSQIVPGVSTNSCDGAHLCDSEPGGPAALLREVLTELRRSRAAEVDIKKLTSRVAALRTACCTLAVERDGWQRQARELRALLASGFNGAAFVAAATAVATPPCPPALQSNAHSATPPQLTLADALAVAHGSRSSGDSMGIAASGGGAYQGVAQNCAVAAQLEDLKKEAALFRQQLSMVLASVGGNVSIPLGVADAGGSRTCGLASGGPTTRPQRAPLPQPRTSDSPQSLATAGDLERSGGGGDAAPAWGVSVFPNPNYGPAPDFFLNTETSGLSAGSGHGGGACDGCPVGEGASARGKSACQATLVQPRVGTGTDASFPDEKQSRRAFPRATSASLAAAAAGPGPRGALAAVQQVKGVAGETTSPNDCCVSPLTASGAVDTSLGTSGTAPNAAAVVPAPLPAPKPDPQQLLGEMRISSATSNGGRWIMTSASAEEELWQANSVSRAPGGPTPSSRRSRSKGGGGSVGTGGILRMLCSKGAALAAVPHTSFSRRNSHQHQHQQQQQQSLSS